MSQARELPGPPSDERPSGSADLGAAGESSGEPRSTKDRTSVACGPEVCPAGMCKGRGHVVVYGNPAMVSRFGVCTGMPAREAMPDLPREAFDLLDAVFVRAKPLARWIRLDGERWRMTAVPRVDAGDGEVYGVSFHLQSASDMARAAAEADASDAGEGSAAGS
jgi:hypothetical protein